MDLLPCVMVLVSGLCLLSLLSQLSFSLLLIWRCKSVLADRMTIVKYPVNCIKR
jgi:hypothetical protein